MSIIVCGQDDVLGESCPGCGGWIHAVTRGGFEHNGWRYCDPECIADYEEHRAQVHATGHRATRDLLCDCADICAPRGLPTAEMRKEYTDYLATLVDGRDPAATLSESRFRRSDRVTRRVDHRDGQCPPNRG